jgi:hypothetical protein
MLLFPNEMRIGDSIEQFRGIRKMIANRNVSISSEDRISNVRNRNSVRRNSGRHLKGGKQNNASKSITEVGKSRGMSV